jgi:Right handed beta helix region
MPLTISELFNDATTREIGGVGPDQVNLIVSDLIGVQQGLNAAFGQVNELTSLHAHVIANQLNEEIATVENANSPAGTPILGTDLGQFVGRAINDIHRDIIDIAQADPGVQAVFNPTPLPPLNTPPAPFHDDATQTAFLTNFIQDSNHLGQAAITIENGGFQANADQLIQQIQTYEQNANAFDQSEGGLWSARFWNELRSDGTQGTAAHALIEGLQTHNVGEVNAAAQQLAMNASDVAGNNLKADGGNYGDVIAAAQATAVTPGTPVAAADGGAAHGTAATPQAPVAAADGVAPQQTAAAPQDTSGAGTQASQSQARHEDAADAGETGAGHHHHTHLVQSFATVAAAAGSPTPAEHGFAPDTAHISAHHHDLHFESSTVDASTHDVTQAQPQPAQPSTPTVDASMQEVAGQPQPSTVDASTHDVTQAQPQPAQPSTATVVASMQEVAQPQPAAPEPPTPAPPVSLTHSTTAIQSSYDGQVIENLDLYIDHGDAVTITNNNVTLRNCLIHYADGSGVSVLGANHVTIENCEIIDTSPPAGNSQGTNQDSNDIVAQDSPNLTVHNVTVRDGSSGMYLVNSPGANISHVDGYDFHGPFPRGQFVQFNNSGNSSLTDFYTLNDAANSSPEDNVSVYASPNTTIARGVIDGNNSETGAAVTFEHGSTGGRVDYVDAIHQGNGAFASYDSNVVFDHTRSFDNIFADQGRGASASNAIIWNVSASGVSILNSTYTHPGNPGNIVWDTSLATVADVHEDPNATPMAHIVNHYAWS